MFVQKNAKRHFCFFAGWFNVPASVVVGNPLAVHLQAELGNLTAVIPAAIYTAIFPRFTRSVTTGATEQLLRDFKIVNRIVNISIACLMSFIGLFSVQLINCTVDTSGFLKDFPSTLHA